MKPSHKFHRKDSQKGGLADETKNARASNGAHLIKK